MSDIPLAQFKPGDRVAVRVAHPHAVLYPRQTWRDRTAVRDFRQSRRIGLWPRRCAPSAALSVGFRQCDVWPNYRGGAQDSIDVEIYQYWLERLGEAD